MNPTLAFSLFTVIAFLLFALEVFVPGGLLGAIGVVSLLTACGFAFSAFGPAAGMWISTGLVLTTLVGFIVWLIKLPDTRLGKRFSLESALSTAHSSEDDDSLVGCEGTAETDLRSGGFARINGKKYDVVAARGYIEKGTPLVVTEVHGSRIVVRKREETPS